MVNVPRVDLTFAAVVTQGTGKHHLSSSDFDRSSFTKLSGPKKAKCHSAPVSPVQHSNLLAVTETSLPAQSDTSSDGIGQGFSPPSLTHGNHNLND